MLIFVLLVFALFVGLGVACLFWLDWWWKLIPIAWLVTVIVAAILLFPIIFPAPTVDYTPVACEPVACESAVVTPDEPVVVIPDEPVAETPPAFDGVVINGCPTESLGTHPNSGEPLIFKQNPYPGVLCEYELFYQDKTARIIMPAGQASLVQDWAVTCPTGPACEGTWVATGTIEVPAGWLVHMWVYSSGYSAAARFPTFACEYLAYGNKGHTNANIRTAPWALESGSGTTLNVPACAGFAGEPGK